MRHQGRVVLGVLFYVALSTFCVAQTENVIQTDPGPNPASYSQAALDQLLAPIALYPDTLLSQVLMASTYPLEIVKAQRWLQQHPGLSGAALDSALANEPWDASVRAIAAFPSVVAMMNDNLDWTQTLGDAFLAQEAQVMDTLQRLRQKAQSAGTLLSDDRQQITTEDGDIDIAPTNPDVVYVPVYDPTVVYGSWWWPGYPPLVWAPPSIYGPVGYVVTGFGFGIGISIGQGHFADAHPDWHHHHIMVTHPHFPGAVSPSKPIAWQHDPTHRIGVPYSTTSVREHYLPANPSAVIQRNEYRGFEGRGATTLPAQPARPISIPQAPRAVSPIVPEPRAVAQGDSRRGHASLSTQQFSAPRAIRQPSAPSAHGGGQAPAQSQRHR